MTNAVAPVAVVRRQLQAPPEVVYDEWLDPDGLSDWMCPQPARCVKVETDPRIGGGYRFDIQDEDQTFHVAGHYLALDRPRRLVFTWSCSTWPDPAVQSVVTVTVEPDGPNASITTIEHALLPPGLVQRHLDGWTIIAGQLHVTLASAVARVPHVADAGRASR